jgi:hypothetical protein
MSSLRDNEGELVPTDVAAPPADWEDLSLPDLRIYRRGLVEEEEKISYWRRLVHARIDVLEEESKHERPLLLSELIRVLGDTGTGRARTALVNVRVADDLPQLPVLKDMWVTELDPHDAVGINAAVARLRSAEHQLTVYRRALHERLDAATDELITRYQADPVSALAAFATPHSVSGRAGSTR